MTVKTFTFGNDPIPKRPTKPLYIELVPFTAWAENVRTKCPRSMWDRFRRMCYRRAEYRCEICGESGKDQGRDWPVECHEVWSYNEDLRIQKLVGLVALCPLCHEVKHAGRTAKLDGPKGIARILTRLQRLNDWTEDQAGAHFKEAFRVWNVQSQWDWTLDLTFLDSAAP